MTCLSNYSAFARLMFILFLLFGAGVFPPPAPVFAETTITVTTTADEFGGGSGCSLREAIQTANTGANFGGCTRSGTGSYVIDLPAGTYILTRAGADNTNAAGDLDVLADVTIQGAGEASTIIDGNQATRVFHFDWTTNTHNLSNLTIRNANTTTQSEPAGDPSNPYRAGFGGGILNESYLLRLTNVTVTGNKAQQGGGIYNSFTGNWHVHRLELESVTISNNEARSTTIGQGGGGLFNGSELYGNDVIITGNSATQGGGYYNNSYESVTLNDFTISNNWSEYAAAIDNDLGNYIELRNGVISGNVASKGAAGVYNNKADEYGATNTMVLVDVQITGNSVTTLFGFGGGVTNLKNMTLTNVLIANNEATYGAGVYNGNSYGVPCNLAMTNTSISGNIGKGPNDARGAGIFSINTGQVTLTNSTITGNSAAVAGGIDNRNTVILRNTILAKNSASLFSPDCAGTLTSQGYNIIGNTSGCTFSATTGDKTNVNPLIGPLQDNGGNTLTHALLSGSPAIDASSNANCPAIDQRGFSRPLDGDYNGSTICDMGAYEKIHYSLDALDPSRAINGSGAFVLRVLGAGFESNFQVKWNGQNRVTTFVSSTELRAQINAGDIDEPGSAVISVVDPDQTGITPPTKLFYFGPPLEPRAYLPLVSKNEQ